MTEQSWQFIIDGLDTGNDVVYSLQQADFLQMPEVDFKELARFDPDLRALMN